jgi:hypothetical protein
MGHDTTRGEAVVLAGQDGASIPPRPSALPVMTGAIPAELRERPQWVVWAWTWHPRRGWTKPPYTPGTGGHASSTDPATWRTWTEALAAYRAGGWDGLGYVLRPEDGLIGWDVDCCRDPGSGQLQPWAAAIVADLPTYAEISPSGTGLRIIARGKRPDRQRASRRREDGGQVEIYDGATLEGALGGRYLTLTGRLLDGAPADIRPCQAGIDTVYRRDVLGESAAPSPHGGGAAPDLDADDEALLRAMRAASNGATVGRLLDGDTSDYGGDDSRADMALCCHLAWWTGDAARTDRLFRCSGLMRPKWDARRGEQTYGQRTVARAMAHVQARRERRRRPRSGGAGTAPPAAHGRPANATMRDVLADWLRAAYQPVHRRGQAVYSARLGEAVELRQAGLGLPSDLRDRLLRAVDCPRTRGEDPRPSEPALLRVWRMYLAGAWADLLATLPPEEQAADLTPDGQDELLVRLRRMLMHIVSIGRRVQIDRDAIQTEQEQRSLAMCALIWAEPGRWGRVRDYPIWGRIRDGLTVLPSLRMATPEVIAQHWRARREHLRVAIRQELAGPAGDRDVAAWPSGRLATLCERYGLGQAIQIGHARSRCIELAPEVVAEVLAEPDDPPPTAPGTTDTEGGRHAV